MYQNRTMAQYINIPTQITQDTVDSIESRTSHKVIKNDRIRSIVYDRDGKVVTFCPLSSCNIEDFFTNGSLNANIRVEEYVEGTMINLHHDSLTNEWIISTKSNVGGKNSFYIDGKHHKKSFRDMFGECCSEIGLSLNSGHLSDKFMYSFVMQHIENRIINPVQSNKLYLIAVYEKPTEAYPSSVNMLTNYKDCKDIWMLSDCDIKFPEYYQYNNKDVIRHAFAMPFTEYSIMGVNLFDTTTGNRSKLRNPAYEELKRLRGNQAKLEYHYLILRNQGKIDEFLDFFPEYQEDFNMYECKIMNFTHSLFEHYLSCYLRQEKPLRQYDSCYKTHMYSIHEDYMKNREKTTMNTVEKYVRGIPEAVLMSSINTEFYRPTVQV